MGFSLFSMFNSFSHSPVILKWFWYKEEQITNFYLQYQLENIYHIYKCSSVTEACRIHKSTMNSSSYDYNVSSGTSYRDSYSTAVAKNVIVLALGLTIDYVNGALIHTIRKHQVRILHLFLLLLSWWLLSRSSLFIYHKFLEEDCSNCIVVSY